MELVLDDKGCCFCKKYSSVLNVKDSVLYFILLSKYYYYPNISDSEFKKLFLDKYLCTKCAFKVENVSTFINNLIIRNLQLEVCETKCNLCNEEHNSLYPIKDLSNGFHDKLKMLTETVLKVKDFNPSWKICLKCSYCVVSWSCICDCIWNIIDVEKTNNVSKDINNVISTPQVENGICTIDFRDTHEADKQQTKEIVDLTTDEGLLDKNCDEPPEKPQNERTENPINDDIVESIPKKAKSRNRSKKKKNMVRNPFCIKDIIKRRFENKVHKKLTTSINISDKIKHLKNVDQAIHDFRKITPQIASNKQLMIDIPYVSIENADFSDYTCSVCHKMFTTKTETLLHEVSHSVNISPRVKLPKTALEDINVPNSSIDSATDMLTNLCEVVYSDEEDSNVQTQTTNVTNLRLVRPDPLDELAKLTFGPGVRFIVNNNNLRVPMVDESSFSAQPGSNDIINKMHNYSYLKQNGVSNGTGHFQNVYQMYLLQHQVVPIRPDIIQQPVQQESVLKTMLTSRFQNIIQQEKVPEEVKPAIRVRTDLF